ncbi:MAG: DUF2807 domain-containing protein [Cyclobacteriaceae bacterium]
MKRLFILALLCPFFYTATAQLDVVEVDPFSKIVIHPYFEVELREGMDEKIEFVSSTVDLNKINVEVSGKTLHLYLEDAKVAFKKVLRDNFDPYENEKVRTIITYKQMQQLTVYGDERLTVSSDVDQNKFQLKIYGEVDARFAAIRTGHLKIGLYGENKLKIEQGDAPKQIFSFYGDNEMNAKRLSGSYLKFVNFGNNRLYLGEQDYMKVTAFGDATISVIGIPELDQKITIGDMTYVSREVFSFVNLHKIFI